MSNWNHYKGKLRDCFDSDYRKERINTVCVKIFKLKIFL